MASHLVTLTKELATASAATVPRRISRASYSAADAGIGSTLFGKGKPVILDINRAGSTSVFTVYGSDASDPQGNPSQQNSGTPLAQRAKGDASTVAFQTLIPYVAPSNYNWITTSSYFLITGTVAVTAGAKTITGTSCAFLTELFPGDLVSVNGELHVIDDITTNDAATTLEAWNASGSSKAIATVGAPIPSTAYTITSVGGFALNTLGTAPAAGVIINTYYAAVTSVHAGTTRLVKKQIRSYEFMWCTLAATTAPSATSATLRAVDGK